MAFSVEREVLPAAIRQFNGKPVLLTKSLSVTQEAGKYFEGAPPGAVHRKMTRLLGAACHETNDRNWQTTRDGGRSDPARHGRVC